MAYLRGDYYIWSDGDRLHVWVRGGHEPVQGMTWSTSGADGGVVAEQEPIDRYVLMRLAEMACERNAVARLDAILEESQGNVGESALRQNARLLRDLLAQLERGARIPDANT